MNIRSIPFAQAPQTAAPIAPSQSANTAPTLKPLAEQVYISKQAQQLFDTYTQSANSAKAMYHADANDSSTVASEQMLATVKMVQTRQTTAAITAYLQQQAQAGEMKPTPYAQQDAFTATT